MTLSEWALLGFAGWTVTVLVATIGIPRLSAIALRKARPSSFNASVPHGGERYQRSMRAHLNCVENLPVFASLVLLGSSVEIPSSSFQLAAMVVLPARVLQTVVHVASGSDRAVSVRFVFFCVQLLCFALMAALLALHGLHSR